MERFQRFVMQDAGCNGAALFGLIADGVVCGSGKVWSDSGTEFGDRMVRFDPVIVREQLGGKMQTGTWDLERSATYRFL